MDLEKVEGFEDLENEIWRAIPLDYIEDYDVSNLGRVRSWHNQFQKPRREIPYVMKLKIKKDKGNYMEISLMNKETKIRFSITVHKLVMLAFKGPCPEGLQVAHLNGIAGDNHINNLSYKTPKENSQDRILHGTDPQGERNGNAKLSKEDVLNIFHSRLPSRKIAKLYNINKTNVLSIRNKKLWGFLTKDLIR